MKRIGILIGWLVWTAGVSAQSWSLDDCMKYAVEHATEVKREVVNARQRKQDYQHAVAGLLPTVTGGVQGQYAWGRNIDPETNTYNNVTTFNNYYQLYAELNVFDGFATINALKQAKLSRDYSATAMQKIQDDRAIDVMQKYVDAAYAEASIRIASEKLNESKRMLAKMQRLYELGEKGRPDVVQMESQVAEDEYNLTHQENVAKQSLLALKSAMNFPVDEELKILINEEQKIQIKEEQKNQIDEGRNLKLKTENEEVPESGVNYEAVYQGFLHISPDLKSEFTAQGVDKAKALRSICAQEGIDLSKVIAFGDGQNDCSLLETCGYGVAMGNADEKCKAIANACTCTNDENGIAKFLRERGIKYE